MHGTEPDTSCGVSVQTSNATAPRSWSVRSNSARNRVVQEGMAHRDASPTLVEKRRSHCGRLFKFAEGDLLPSLARID
jgi:hypothetical protein